jgi:hypothetical protein
MTRNFGLYIHIAFFMLLAVVAGFALPLGLGVLFGAAGSGTELVATFDGLWVAFALGVAADYGIQHYREYRGISRIWLEYEVSAYMSLGIALAFYAGCLHSAGYLVLSCAIAAAGALFLISNLIKGPVRGWESWQYAFDTGVEAGLMKIKKALLRRGAPSCVTAFAVRCCQLS